MKITNPSRVLYAEDNEDECYMLSVLLEFVNIEVKCAKTVDEAWRLAKTEKFDLYLLDVHFPKGNGLNVQFPNGDGLELCRSLREYAPHKPIIFYSGNAYEADKQKGLAAGATAY